MKKLFLFVFFYLAFYGVAFAEVTDPLYIVDYKSPVMFGDSVAVGNYIGLQNYTTDYVGGYLHISYTITHGVGSWASFPPTLYIFSADPTKVANVPILYQASASSFSMFDPTDVYFVDVQFSQDGYNDTVTEGTSTLPFLNSNTSVPGMSGETFVALANRYPLQDPPISFSMAFQPMRLTAVAPSEILSFDVSTSTMTASAHDYISTDDVGAVVNFKISDLAGNQVYTSAPVVATTTGDFYYTWNFPALTDTKTTKPEDFVFHTDISDNSQVLKSSDQTVAVSSQVVGYPGYENLGDDASQAPMSSYDHLLQTLGVGLSGVLTQIDVESNNPNVDYYGSRPALIFYECPDENYGSPSMSGIGCTMLYNGLADDMSQKTAGVQSFYLDSPITLDPSKYYFFLVQGNNQNSVFSYFYGSSADTVEGGCYWSRSSPDMSGIFPCPNVSDLYFYLRGVTKTATPACASDCFSNVLFLPGIEASRLYKPAVFGSDENRLWEPDNDQDVENLFLDQNGKSVSPDIYTRDVMDNAYGFIGVYGSFLDTLKNLKSDGKIADYSAVPYDWRLSIDDILNGGMVTNTGDGDNISYLNPSGDPYIISELRRLAASSKSGKVTIVAHSNGGLVAKVLLKRLSDTNDPLLSKIDQLIFVAVPQLGTPEAIAADLHGYEQDIPTGKLSEHTAREFAQNSSPAYNLLPDQNYFTYVDTPVVTFDPALTDWISRYGSTIHSEETLNDFLTDTYGRTSASGTDIETPIALNSELLSQADELHAGLDTWLIPANIKVTEIAGWGIPTTVSGINYVKENGAIEPNMNTTIDGDGTVTTPSALWADGESVEKYWVDEGQYNKDHQIQTLGVLLPFKHANILEVNKLDNFISDTITDSIQPISSYIYLSTEAPLSTEKRLSYALHSPLTLDMYDDQGRHTGISTTTGQVEEQIPGTYYSELGGVKYIFTDTDIPTHIVMNGYAAGTFTFNVSELSGDTLVASTTFKDIPTSPTTRVTLGVQNDITTVSPMNIDTNGDGQTDFVVVPKLNGVATLDQTPPTTTAAVSGTKGKNGWYTGNVTIKLNATDDNSGVAATSYSTTGGSSWIAYSTNTPVVISTEGSTTLLYYSADNAGNREATSTLIIKIDKTAPEAILSFNSKTQKLDIIGKDNLSGTTVTTVNPKSILEPSTSVISDEAGHTLTITYAQPILFNLKGDITVMIKKLAYDTGVTSKVFPLSILLYDWSLDKKGNFTEFSQKSIADKTIMSGDYDPKKDTTKLTTMIYTGKDTDSDRQLFDHDDHQDKNKVTVQTLPGMVILKLQTNKGNVTISY